MKNLKKMKSLQKEVKELLLKKNQQKFKSQRTQHYLMEVDRQLACQFIRILKTKNKELWAQFQHPYTEILLNSQFRSLYSIKLLPNKIANLLKAKFLKSFQSLLPKIHSRKRRKRKKRKKSIRRNSLFEIQN